MTLSVRSTAIRVRSLLGARGQDVSNLRTPRIAALINPALETMAYRVAEGKDYKGLQKDFAVTPVAGLVDRTSLSTAIFDIARSRVKVASTGVLLTPFDSLRALMNLDPQNDQVYYAQDGLGIRFRATDGTFNTYATPVIIIANHIPTLAQLPFEYEGLFIETLAGLIEPRAEVRAQVMSEAGRA